MTQIEKLRSIVENKEYEKLAEFLLNFPKENIVYEWCSMLCPHRIIESDNYSKCEIDLENNACPCYTRDIVIHWLKSEVKEQEDEV